MWSCSGLNELEAIPKGIADVETIGVDSLVADNFVSGPRQMCSESFDVNHKQSRMREAGRLEIGIGSKMELLAA
jgi:hypothetical protein